MCASYLLVEMQKFPDPEDIPEIEPPFQTVFNDDFRDLDPPHTIFKYTRRIDELKARVYQCVHERTINMQGRARGVAFPFFIGKETFASYYFESPKLLIIKAAKKVSKSSIKELARHDAVEYESQVISLQSIRDHIDRLKGAYLTVDDSSDISSVAFWGPSVDNDLRFEKAMGEGKIYNMRLDYEYKGAFIHTGISEDMGVVLYDSNLDEQSELSLILDIKTRLLDKAKPKDV